MLWLYIARERVPAWDVRLIQNLEQIKFCGNNEAM